MIRSQSESTLGEMFREGLAEEVTPLCYVLNDKEAAAPESGGSFPGTGEVWLQSS